MTMPHPAHDLTNPKVLGDARDVLARAANRHPSGHNGADVTLLREDVRALSRVTRALLDYVIAAAPPVTEAEDDVPMSRRDEISARLSRVNGPWHRDGDVIVANKGMPRVAVADRNMTEGTADLIAHAPSDLAWLLDRHADAEAAVAELVEALRLTVEYVGTSLLPPVEGWSWYDALVKHAPDVARHFSEYAAAEYEAMGAAMPGPSVPLTPCNDPLCCTPLEHAEAAMAAEAGPECAHDREETADWPLICGEGCRMVRVGPHTVEVVDASGLHVAPVGSHGVDLSDDGHLNPPFDVSTLFPKGSVSVTIGRADASKLRGFTATSRPGPTRIVTDDAGLPIALKFLPSWETLRRERGWPTPNNLRRAADSLDGLTPAAYGDLLRYVADACDGLPEAPRG